MTARPRLVIATHSAHKLRELRELLALDHAELVSLDDLGITEEPVEDGETFQTNAAIKAGTTRLIKMNPLRVGRNVEPPRTRPQPKGAPGSREVTPLFSRGARAA